MFYRLIFLIAAFVAASFCPAAATTWDEPWHSQVVKAADSFIMAKIGASDEHKGITATVIQTLGGAPITGKIQINDFYLLNMCSSSGHGPELHMGDADTCYFFLKKNAAGTYSLPTPTTGFAPLSHKTVMATYRHSYHQAMVPQAVYEATMTAIFLHAHGQPYDSDYIAKYVSTTLALPPATIDKAGMTTFFQQHVALETMYHLGWNANYELVLPFLRDTKNFHAQISAARALTGFNTPDARQQLLTLLRSKETDGFAKTMAVWTLASFQPKELKPELEQLARSASAGKDGFGGNIMDPRVCTRIPTVKEALLKLVASL
ncbi:hypothetical protein GCM10023185_28750 [Hymenobacter saemangeumensis]|uniref:HEAT repeat domain-containing protein n=1 Tax=Hymenobacter saemangeumensis TaxID=1084522 RepID=A0ABP8IKM3_9BACT